MREWRYVEDLLWSIIPWGYQVLLTLEGMRSGLPNLFFAVITDVGSGIGYLVILTLIYWCVDKRVGQGLAYAHLFTATLNCWLKDLVRMPRPDDPALEDLLQQAGIAGRVQPLRHESSPAFPSGHTQGAMVAWGYMAYHFKKLWVSVLAILIIALIGFSRMYLGVHYPQDVIAGLIIGAVYLALWLWAEPYVRRWLSSLHVGWRYVGAVLVPLAVLVVHPVEATATTMGAVLGLGVGFVSEGQTLRFETGGQWWQRVLRGALGLVGIAITYGGLSVLFALWDVSAPFAELAWRVIRYALLGFVGGWGLPWLFTVIGLASRAQPGTKLY
jgi:membrane-associated phospholipid phosphatase